MTKKNKYPESIEVFGTKYTLSVVDQPDEHMYEGGYSGYVDMNEKKIIIMNRDDSKRILIHELIHAHLYECGLRATSNDEQLVETLTEIYERISHDVG